MIYVLLIAYFLIGLAGAALSLQSSLKRLYATILFWPLIVLALIIRGTFEVIKDK